MKVIVQPVTDSSSTDHEKMYDENKQETQPLSENEKAAETYQFYHDERVFDADFFDSVEMEEKK
jgi:hypothetical protein